MDVHSNTWNADRVRQVIAEEDVNLVLNTKFVASRTDSICWGLAPNGKYDSRSGYKLLDSLSAIRSDAPNTLPPLEKQLWRKLWKSKTSPKLCHFMWRVLSGPLAVKSQLRSRGLPLDTTCPVCHQDSETICHMLFHCPIAKEVWQASNVPLPPGGWSPNSVFLNIHYLISCSQKQSIGESVRLAFPWILWQIWKARNKFCFERVIPVSSVVVSTAMDEAVLWLKLHGHLGESSITPQTDHGVAVIWEKPPPSYLKCNIGSSWCLSSLRGGASWI